MVLIKPTKTFFLVTPVGVAKGETPPLSPLFLSLKSSSILSPLSVLMDSSQWPHSQGTGNMNSMEGTIASSAWNKSEQQAQGRRMAKPREQLSCPRCNSSTTKFCYYNNCSLTQPRYLCKTCRRYWTEGGSLRNVPVGGGSRKNKNSPSPTPTPTSSASSSLASAKMVERNPQNLQTSYEAQDLTLSFPKFESNPPFSSLSAFGGYGNAFIPNLMPHSPAIYSPGFSLQEVKPAMGASGDGFGSRYGGEDGNGGRVLFPFADFKQTSSSVDIEVTNDIHGRGQGSSIGYWNEMSNGGSW